MMTTIDDAHGTDLGNQTHALLGSLPTGCFIAGSWRQAHSAAVFAVYDPATGQLLREVADADRHDAVRALDAAVAVQDAWAAYSPRRRSDILLLAYTLLSERTEEFARLITLEMGKPLAEARGEVAYAADFLRWFSEQAVRIGGEYRLSPDGASRLVTVPQPVGPCLLIAPWNFPLAMITRKLAAALAAGCTTILKPAEDTPLTCLLFAQLLADVGVPPGVVNILPTSDPGAVVGPLLADPRLRKVSFTGSTGVGRHLMAQAATNILRCSMELGGNSPLLVFDDADLNTAVEGALLAKMRNGGESCVAVNRILVQDGVAQEFTERLVARMRSFQTGHGLDPATTLGPIINAKQRGRLDDLVQDAVRAGATPVIGGTVPDGPGYFYPATVLTDVPPQSRIFSEEVFGPVAAVYTFATEAEAISLANDTPFGLVSYLFTQDAARTIRVGEALEAGMVGINRGLVSNAAAPFGGTKQSGTGREGGYEGINEYLTVKYLAVGF